MNPNLITLEVSLVDLDEIAGYAGTERSSSSKECPGWIWTALKGIQSKQSLLKNKELVKIVFTWIQWLELIGGS